MSWFLSSLLWIPILLLGILRITTVNPVFIRPNIWITIFIALGIGFLGFGFFGKRRLPRFMIILLLTFGMLTGKVYSPGLVDRNYMYLVGAYVLVLCFAVYTANAMKRFKRSMVGLAPHYLAFGFVAGTLMLGNVIEILLVFVMRLILEDLKYRNIREQFTYIVLSSIVFAILSFYIIVNIGTLTQFPVIAINFLLSFIAGYVMERLTKWVKTISLRRFKLTDWKPVD